MNPNPLSRTSRLIVPLAIVEVSLGARCPRATIIKFRSSTNGSVSGLFMVQRQALPYRMSKTHTHLYRNGDSGFGARRGSGLDGSAGLESLLLFGAPSPAPKTITSH